MLAEQQNKQVTGSAMKVTFAVPVPDTVAGIVSQHILFSAVKIYLPSKSPALDSIFAGIPPVPFPVLSPRPVLRPLTPRLPVAVAPPVATLALAWLERRTRRARWEARRAVAQRSKHRDRRPHRASLCPCPSRARAPSRGASCRDEFRFERGIGRVEAAATAAL